LTFHFNKKDIQHALLLTGFALVSIGWLAALWLVYNNQAPGLLTTPTAAWGRAAFLGFGTVAFIASIPCALVMLAHKFIPDEREHYKRTQSTMPQVTILENQMASLRYTKHHPTLYLLLCIIDACFLGIGTFVFPLSSHNGNDVFWFCLFAVLGLAFILVACLICFAVRTKRWEPYMDTQIQKLETRIAQARRRYEENSMAGPSPLSQLAKRFFRR
jgi:hypothetical protein